MIHVSLLCPYKSYLSKVSNSIWNNEIPLLIWSETFLRLYLRALRLYMALYSATMQRASHSTWNFPKHTAWVRIEVLRIVGDNFSRVVRHCVPCKTCPQGTLPCHMRLRHEIVLQMCSTLNWSIQDISVTSKCLVSRIHDIAANAGGQEVKIL